MEHFIKRGVTVYSFKQLVARGELTWDQCIAAMSAMGVTGVELLGQLFFRNCPDIIKEDTARWKEMMWKYGTKTIAHDFFVDRTMFKNRVLTLRESVDIVKRHVQFAAAIECPIIRIGGTFEPELFSEAAPICEEYGVKLGVEIHNGSSSWILPSIQKTIEIIRQKNTPYLGIIPDMSMFVRHIRESSYFVRAARRNGVRPDLIEFMKEAYENESNDAYRARCDEMLKTTTDPNEAAFIVQCRRTEYHDPRQLLEHMPYIVHIHGKFWEMDENCEETSINYPAILPILAEGGYTGYISSEYEGGEVAGDPFEPLRRYQTMLDRYLGTYPGFQMPALGAKSSDTEALSNRGYRNRYDAVGNCTGLRNLRPQLLLSRCSPVPHRRLQGHCRRRNLRYRPDQLWDRRPDLHLRRDGHSPSLLLELWPSGHNNRQQSRADSTSPGCTILTTSTRSGPTICRLICLIGRRITMGAIKII